LYKNREGYGHKKKNPFSINTDHKQLVNFDVFNNIVKDGFQVLEPFAGEGRFTKILLQRSELRKVICIEENPTAFSILSSIDDQRCHFINDDNRHILRENKDKFDLIDLDPFSSCHEQLETIWKNLKDQSYLFLTFGGEYRRSFINSNRKSMVERYNFTDFDSANSEYLENIPYYFLGDVARRCSNNGFTFEVIRAVRYANYCRFWLDVTRNERSKDWFSDAVNVNSFGQQFVNVSMPRFKEIRSEIDKAKEQGFSL
jgi:tRNA G26 N,N-dimethylase Trm1